MIVHTLIEDYEEAHAPPSQQVLSVSVVDGVVFLAIGSYEDGPDARLFTTSPEKQIAVSGQVLADAITAGANANVNRTEQRQ